MKTILPFSVGVYGTWRSSADSVLQVDSRSGAAVARDSGTVTVFYEIPGVLKTYREVSYVLYFICHSSLTLFELDQ